MSFRRFTWKGVWWRSLEAPWDNPDFEYLMPDPTIVPVRHHAAGARKGRPEIGPHPTRHRIKPWAARAVA